MMQSAGAIFLCLVFLSGLDRGLFQPGQCTDKKCFAVFPEAVDFTGAKKLCEERGALLMTVKTNETHDIVVRLLNGFKGKYWIGLQLKGSQCPDVASPLRGYKWSTGETASSFHKWRKFSSSCSKCVSVSAEEKATWVQEPCSNTLQGVLCESSDESCSGLPNKNVKYSGPMYFQGNIFPTGSKARVLGLDSDYVEAEHICASGEWLQAPWSCEVQNGGCENLCEPQANRFSCACPTGQTLQSNNITCSVDPCAECAECKKEGNTYVCACKPGHMLAGDRKACVDINECIDVNTCPLTFVCENTEGSFRCECSEGFLEEDGKCVNVEICDTCEHRCEKSEGQYICICDREFIVSPDDPTKCIPHCTEKACQAKCIGDISSPEPQCDCPNGYIQDVQEDKVMCADVDECGNQNQCDHTCSNTYGSYRCSCNYGFDLVNEHKCEKVPFIDVSLSTPILEDSTPKYKVVVKPTAFPTYVKTGSVMGIVAFIVFTILLLFFMARQAHKRCRTLTLPRDVDIFYLHQVTTEKYKKFSFDKQW